MNDNTYKLDLRSEYNVSATFNVADLSPFLIDDERDLKANPSQDEGNDVVDEIVILNLGVESVKVPMGLASCARAKKFKESLQTLIHAFQD